MNSQLNIQVFIDKNSEDGKMNHLIDSFFENGWSLAMGDNKIWFYDDKIEEWVIKQSDSENLKTILNLIKKRLSIEGGFIAFNISHPDVNGLVFQYSCTSKFPNYILLSLFEFNQDFYQNTKNDRSFLSYLRLVLPIINAVYQIEKVVCYIGDEYSDEFPPYKLLEGEIIGRIQYIDKL